MPRVGTEDDTTHYKPFVLILKFSSQQSLHSKFCLLLQSTLLNSFHFSVDMSIQRVKNW